MNTYRVVSMNGSVRLVDCDHVAASPDGWLRFTLANDAFRPVLLVKSTGIYMVENISAQMEAFKVDLEKSDIPVIPDLS